MKSPRDAVKSSLMFARNRELHEKELVENICDLVVYYVFDHCCALCKQCSIMPKEKLRKNFIKWLTK